MKINNYSTLFLDESGKASLIEKAEEPFLITGAILNNSEINIIEGFFTYIKRKFSLNTDKPFHSYDIFENPKTKLPESKAKSLSKSLAEFLSLIPIKINIIKIDKDNFKKALKIKSNNDFKGNKKKKELKESPYKIISSYLFSWFAQDLNNNKSIGEIVVDARRGGDYQLIKSLYLCKDPNGPLKSEEIKLIKEKCTAICFAEKNFLSGGIEITDLISYTSFFHARRLMNSMKNIGLPIIWNEIKAKLNNQKLNELSEKQIKSFFKIKKDEVYKIIKIN